MERGRVVLGCNGRSYCIGSPIVEKNPKHFGWLTLVSGMGDLNMNQMKTFFKDCDKGFLKPLVERS